MTPEQDVIEGEAVFIRAMLRDLEDLLGEWSAEQHAEVMAMLLGFVTAIAKRRTELGVGWREEQRALLIRALGEKKGLDAEGGGCVG